ncbi:predicted protein [Sclerotinia sclerotiorum 1980 UF-70]|uniref:Uncharacterized protein n=1 Tax=Sclerotinia sclerotiorum (strain ATCC 18683 / 1980 / Ss-1) TaxID=665079 RepID=A7EG88_SCLS1|nr:predicted protein [Sclerotinia sclerotiorum 1980 UF-70]EDO01854.1 predicted protein [Sclerotinia sclerotiorum 1980 UF-70]
MRVHEIPIDFVTRLNSGSSDVPTGSVASLSCGQSPHCIRKIAEKVRAENPLGYLARLDFKPLLGSTRTGDDQVEEVEIMVI